jgi:hypothetical protein
MPETDRPTINVSHIYGNNKLRDSDRILSCYFSCSNDVSKIFPDIYSLPKDEAIAKLKDISRKDLKLFSDIYNADEIWCPLNSHGERCDSPWYIEYAVESFHKSEHKKIGNNLLTIVELNASEKATSLERKSILEKVNSYGSLLVLYSTQEKGYRSRIMDQKKVWGAKEIFIFNDGFMNVDGVMAEFLGIPARDWLYRQQSIFDEVSRQIGMFK